MRVSMTLGALALCAVLSLVATEQPNATADSGGRGVSSAELKRQRHEAAHRRRRIIMNNDGNDARNVPNEPHTHENFLSKRTSPLAGTQVDAIFYCSGVFNLYTHHSTESEPRVHADRQELDWAWELGNHGPDTLATVVAFGHKHKMEVFWSMRMNDTHDSADPAMLSQWKRQHPDCLMGKKGQKFRAGGGRWSALDYAKPEVREKVFRILRDVATRYDVDGLEMDFMRSPVYFKPQMLGKPVTQAERDMMTELLRRVREMADQTAAQRGRPMLVAVRVPDSVEYSAALGLDMVRWLKEDLIDLMTVGCFYQLNPWETSVTLGHQYGVPVYPSLSEPRFADPRSQQARLSLPCYRGRALEAWNAGADGIYMFNFFDPHSPLWRELGDPAELQNMDQLYPAGTMATAMVKWLDGGMKWMKRPVPLPEKRMTLAPGGKAVIDIPVAAAVGRPPGPPARVHVQLLVADPTKAERLIVKLNERPLPEGKLAGGWLEYAVDPPILKQGVTRLELSLPAGGSKLRVLDAAIVTGHH